MRKNNMELRNEHEAVRERVGFHDFTHELLEVTGRDARSFLDQMLVNDIASCSVGQGKYTTMLNEKGHIIDDVIIFRLKVDTFWISTLDIASMIAWFEKYAAGYQVDFKDITGVTTMYTVQGPKSREVINDIVTDNVDDLSFNWIKDNKIDNVPVKVARCGFTGELGYELYFAPEHTHFIETKLFESGQPFDIVEVETDVVLSSLPTEKGLMLMRDLEGLDPVEAGLGWSVNWDKDFVGKEAAQLSKDNGPKRSIVGFTVEDDYADVELGATINLDGTRIRAGTVTNYTYGFTAEKNIGFAVINNVVAKIGDTVTIGDQHIEAVLTDKVFYDPRNTKRTGDAPSTETVEPNAKHPLEPLTSEEITKAIAIVREEKGLGSEIRFEQAGLHEPPKDLVLNFKDGDPIDRRSFMVLLNRETNRTFEVVVSITDEKVVRWSEVPAGQQASFVLDEYTELEETVKNNPDFQKAAAKRGVTDMDLVMVDPWSAGYFGIEEDEGRRIGRALCFVRRYEGDNAYGYPLTGLIPVVDLNTNEVIRIEDSGARPLPPTDANYVPELAGIRERTDLKPLEISMPEGPSYEIDGHFVKWQKWQFRIGYTAREGLVLYTVGYEDEGNVRPVMYRAALSEMIVPYGYPDHAHNWQNAFDAGEYGLGQLANSLILGCDCKGEIDYFDAVLCDGEGEATTIPNAICMHEEDYGIAWKHTDFRTGEMEVRRSRRLVISFFTTVANYDYGFYWYLYTDGTIEHEVKATGMLNVSAMYDGEEKTAYGAEVAPRVFAPHHQHFFNYRIDTQVDGEKNSVIELNTVPADRGRDNPNNNAFQAEVTTFETEMEARRNMNLETARRWRIINEHSKNRMGQPVGYSLEPGENCSPMANDDASVIKRAPFLKKHLHVTQYDENEMFAPGDYPNQKKGGSADELSKYAEQNRNIRNEDIVLWYNVGLHHYTRPEDFPVMPTAYIGFKLKPVGFFDKNPALDLPRPTKEEQRKN